jgi:hypothetical protein
MAGRNTSRKVLVTPGRPVRRRIGAAAQPAAHPAALPAPRSLLDARGDATLILCGRIQGSRIQKL